MPDRRRPPPHDHAHGFRPPWWPEGEPFPPVGGPWHAMRGRFLRRVAIMLAVFFGLLFLAGWLSWAIFGGAFHGGTGRGPFFPGFLAILLIVGFVGLGRAVRRTAGPISDVMDAASRVAEGDYSARAPVGGPPDVRELARAFNSMAERIGATEEQRRNLLADVTHELRTPLAAIQGRVEGMLDGVYETDREHLSLVVEQARVMARLLDDLQLLSRTETGALSLHRELLEARELVDGAAKGIRADADAAGVELRTQVATGLPRLDADRVRMGEVLANLLTNALRYTPRGGAVTLAAGPADDGVAFSVTDTGAGIPADELPHVFDRFRKSSDSRGAGLGLAIAKGLVRAHGGTIAAKSEPGRGTTIRFVVPAART